MNRINIKLSKEQKEFLKMIRTLFRNKNRIEIMVHEFIINYAETWEVTLKVTNVEGKLKIRYGCWDKSSGWAIKRSGETEEGCKSLAECSRVLSK